MFKVTREPTMDLIITFDYDKPHKWD